eukprot:scaffold120872_cov57-Phaeocystis_antarctica.AAC.3
MARGQAHRERGRLSLRREPAASCLFRDISPSRVKYGVASRVRLVHRSQLLGFPLRGERGDYPVASTRSLQRIGFRADLSKRPGVVTGSSARARCRGAKPRVVLRTTEFTNFLDGCGRDHQSTQHGEAQVHRPVDRGALPPRAPLAARPEGRRPGGAPARARRAAGDGQPGAQVGPRHAEHARHPAGAGPGRLRRGGR